MAKEILVVQIILPPLYFRSNYFYLSQKLLLVKHMFNHLCILWTICKYQLSWLIHVSNIFQLHETTIFVQPSFLSSYLSVQTCHQLITVSNHGMVHPSFWVKSPGNIVFLIKIYGETLVEIVASCSRLKAWLHWRAKVQARIAELHLTAAGGPEDVSHCIPMIILGFSNN